MKNLIKNSLVLVVMFTTLLSNANDIFVLKNLKDSKTTMLTLLDVKKGNQLVIKDGNGYVLYKEKIQITGVFTKGFNFTLLPSGEYYIEFKQGVEIKTMPFKVDIDGVENGNTKNSFEKSFLKQSKTKKMDNDVEKRIMNFKERYYLEYNNQIKK